eukprot:COSAG01_NODE_2974_length_6772_cov_6.475948_1_plen_142_part_10
MSTSQKTSLGQGSILCSGRLDQAQEPSFCLATSPVDPIQLTIFRLVHDMCTHYRRQFTDFEDHTAPKYRDMGAVAASEVNGKLVPLEYYSANHTPAARRYSSSEREALALVCATTHFAPLISGSRWKCRVLTDHSGLTSLIK